MTSFLDARPLNIEIAARIMAEETADGRRPSMYDPARDIFAKEQKDDGSAERGTTTHDTSASHEGETAPNVTTSTAISQAISGLHYDPFPVSKS
jgi:mRNA (guanine-N7-)-methyltransferase